MVLKALANKDINTLREISNYFYRTSGIYFRICNYFAQMYRYDWYIVDEVYDNKVDVEKINKETEFALKYFNIEVPGYLEDVKLQIKDINYYKDCFLNKKESISKTYDYMFNKNITKT